MARLSTTGEDLDDAAEPGFSFELAGPDEIACARCGGRIPAGATFVQRCIDTNFDYPCRESKPGDDRF